MLSLLKIRNVALIDALDVEFGPGLNLLTGETGSGKSIIVDSLAALTGERVTSDLVKQGAERAEIEGLFTVEAGPELQSLLENGGIDPGPDTELIVRREIALTGKNRVFVNDRLVTQGLLQQIGAFLADIHGQGEQASLYDPSTHIAMLDETAKYRGELAATADAYEKWAAVREELNSLEKDESEKLQLIDILKFQIDEISAAALSPGEDEELEAEKRRVANSEKLSALSAEVHALLYDDEHSTLATLDKATRAINELAGYDASFRGYEESLESARAVISDLGATARDFTATLDVSPGRLDEIENRLAEITRLKRKYGDTIDAILQHLAQAAARLEGIETAEFREQQLRKELAAAAAAYSQAAAKLTDKRKAAARSFEKTVTSALAEVALEKARFEVRFAASGSFSRDGSDSVEFFFSANPGETPRPLARVASGGEASRLMLILKTSAGERTYGKTAVFDEVDIGIGGRVAEAVGRKLKNLAATQQVLCVTHQPQIASLADQHFVVEKDTSGKRTTVSLRELSAAERVDEIARMLAGSQITEAARENAKTMLAAGR